MFSQACLVSYKDNSNLPSELTFLRHFPCPKLGYFLCCVLTTSADRLTIFSSSLASETRLHWLLKVCPGRVTYSCLFHEAAHLYDARVLAGKKNVAKETCSLASSLCTQQHVRECEISRTSGVLRASGLWFQMWMRALPRSRAGPFR